MFKPFEAWGGDIATKNKKAESDRAALENAKKAATERRATLSLSDYPDIFTAFNAVYTPHDWMITYGYDQDGDKFRHPHSESGSYSVSVRPDANGVLRANSLSTRDPLYSGGKGARDAFDVFCILAHNGDRDAALKDAGDNLLTIGRGSYNKAKQIEYKKREAAQQPAPTTAKAAFAFISAAELTAKPAKIDWLVRGILEQASLNLLFGPPGSGKSLFALEWAWCVAFGIDWNGHPTKQMGVYIIAGEGYAGLARRLKALEHKYDRKAPANLFISKHPAQFSDPQNVKMVADEIAALNSPPGLVIIDTLHRNMQGDENSSQDIGIVISHIDNFIKPLGAGVLIVHHSGHGDQQRSRGSSSIRAAMDGEFSAIKQGNDIILTCHKAKDFEPFSPLQFGLKTVCLDWMDDDLKPLKSVYLEHMGAATPKTSGSKISKSENAILTALDDAVKEHGIEPTAEIKRKFDGFDSLVSGDTQKIVQIDHWRDQAYKTISVTSGSETKPESKQAAKRAAFNRARNKLFDKGFTVQYGDYVWRQTMESLTVTP